MKETSPRVVLELSNMVSFKPILMKFRVVLPIFLEQRCNTTDKLNSFRLPVIFHYESAPQLLINIALIGVI